jgi:hypothetical protein
MYTRSQIDVSVFVYLLIHTYIYNIYIFHYTDRAHPPRRACRAEAAHTLSMVVTDAVFHLLMSALNFGELSNACEPTTRRSTAARSARQRGADACAPNHT